MSAPPLLGLKDAYVSFGGRPLFTGVTLQVGRGDKCCLVGRNGSGKSTLLKVLAGELQLDQGDYFRQPGARLALLAQDPKLTGQTIEAWVADGLPPDERDQSYRIDAILENFQIDGQARPENLSGGEARRVALARALIGEPDILLMDEPTNHLDLPTILQLEKLLAGFKGALVVISHDRAFLASVSKQILWLDRGVVRRSEQGFTFFESWQEQIQADEEAELQRMDKKLQAETHWLHRGVTARRKRNMGRLHALMALRQTRASHLAVQGSVKLAVDSGEQSGRLVIEAKNISKSFGERSVVKNFSTRIMRGDRVGIIGPNGAGKTTLLKLLTGALPVDTGSVRLGTNLQIALVDQQRSLLDPDSTVWNSLTDGAGDSVTVRGQQRHVMGYLRDFLFEDRQAHSPVRSLSGGERNRLLLAKLLAKPSNLLILDEPTNDLDMDTLDLLEETLADYDGTLLLVSHDRDFLDRLATSVIFVDGEGQLEEYVGGYSDALRQRGTSSVAAPTAPASAPKQGKNPPTPVKPARSKMSYKDQRELTELPVKIDRLAKEIAEIEQRLADPALYRNDAKRFAQLSERLTELLAERDSSEQRWLELEMLREEQA